MITSLHAKNLRRLADVDVRFDDDAQLVLVAGRNGAGKCLPGDTRLHDAATGESVPIRTVVAERRSRVLGIVDGKVVPVTVTDWHTLGPKPLVAVTLANGATLTTATTHPLLTDRGCVRAGDLRPGDWVAEVRRLPALGPARITTDEALIVGLLLGDGTVTSSISLSAADPDVVDLFRTTVERAFPPATISKQGTSGNYRVVSSWSAEQRRAARIRLHDELVAAGVPLTTYLRNTSLHRFRRGEHALPYATLVDIEAEYGLDLTEYRWGLHGGRSFYEWAKALSLTGKTAHTKHVPGDLLHLPEAQTRSLIAGLWQTDGWFSGGVAAIGTASPRLARDIRLLLLRLGILSSVRGRRGDWRVSVTVESTTRFADVELVGAKAAARDTVLARIGGRARNGNSDLIPPSLCADLPTRSASGRHRTRRQLARHAMSRDLYADFGGDPAVLSTDFTWSRVEQVADAGSDDCYDITVDTDDHLYVAETFVVHNSTLFEAVLFAFYGESRHGRRDLDTMIRRGTETAEVAVTFTVDTTPYTVHRTRSRNGSTATLHTGGVVVADRPGAVTDAVTELLGLDGTGFRLAYLAQQGELDGLTSLRPNERTAAVGRLLRLDLLTGARDAARRDARAARAALDTLGPAPDLVAARDAVRTARRDAEAAEAALHAARAAVTALDAAVARDDADPTLAGAATRAAHTAGRVDALDGARTALVGRAAMLDAELARLADDGAETDPGPLADALAAADAALARAEVTVAVLAGRDLAAAELSRIDAALAGLSAADPVSAEAELVCADAAARDAAAKAAAADRAVADAGAAEAAAQTTAAAARRHLQALEEADAVCPTCTAPLPDRRRDALLRAAAATVDTASRASADATEATRRARGVAESYHADAAERAREHAARQTAFDAAVAADHRKRDLVDRRDVAAAQLAAAAAVDAVDVTAVRVERDRLSDRLRAARRYVTVTAELDDVRRRIDQLTAEIAELHSGDDPAVLEAVAAARQRRIQRDDEARLAAELAVTATAARGRVAVARERFRAAVGEHRRRRTLTARAADAADAATVLDRAAALLAGRVRPALTAAVSDTLARLSAGRFPGVVIDDDYGVTVVDDGAPRRLDELSGGEQDLVALAMRLGLAEVIGGGSGWGSLWLDEVLGSQDAGRRAAVVDALRELRTRWPQIVVVSHVDGFEDAVDQVVTVTTAPAQPPD